MISPPKAHTFKERLSSLDLAMNPDDEDDENISPALLSARNSALSVFDDLFAEEDKEEDSPKSIDSADMPKLRYSIGTSGDRQHLARDIHCAHKGGFGGLDLHRQLQVRKAASAARSPLVGLFRIPVARPALVRAKSCVWPTSFKKRKSEPSLAQAVRAQSPPKPPKKSVSFADVRDAPSASLRSSGRASDGEDAYATDDDEEEQHEPAGSPTHPGLDQQQHHGAHYGAPPAMHADEWAAAQHAWAWDPQAAGDAAAYGMAPQMVVPMMGGGGLYPSHVYVEMPEPQLAAVMYPPEFGYHADAGYYAPMPLMPQMAMPQMAWPMHQPMPQPMPQMAQQMQQMEQMQHMQHMQHMAQMQHMAPPMPPGMHSAPTPMASAPASAAPPTRGRAGASDNNKHHAAAPAGRTRGALVSVAKEQQGSRRLQGDLSRMSDAQLEGACAELAPHLLELAMHPFGNYVVSKLAGRPQAQPHLVSALRGHVVELLQHAQGSRVVQATIGALPAAEAAALVAELDGHVFQCALDTHGSWGVCAAFKHTHSPFIVGQMAGHMAALATQQHGIRVVQQVLNEAAACGMDVGEPVQALLEGELSFVAQHAYGNYAVQAALRHAAPAQRAAMLAALLPGLLPLSRSKHGSNVAEMVLMRASPRQLEQIRGQIFGAERPEQLRELMASPYGNYVLQALLRQLEPGLHAAALQRIEAETSSSNFGRAIIAAAAA